MKALSAPRAHAFAASRLRLERERLHALLIENGKR